MSATRRQALFGCVAAGAMRAWSSPSLTQKRPHLTAALQVATWIDSARIVTPAGLSWLPNPDEPTFDPALPTMQTLYSHSPGVVLFLLELYRATGDRNVLAQACAGADHLTASLPANVESQKCGLYIGIAGIAYVLELTHEASGEAKYRRAAVDYIQAIERAAITDSEGASWGDENDIVFGSAGTGLTLLWWAERTHSVQTHRLATAAGRKLLARAESTPDGGLRWRASGAAERLMPNFSHGTAGTAYFLATLYAQTRERAFLDAALRAARHVLTIAEVKQDTCSIRHHFEADGTPADLYYWGWCHGPVGTWRLFHRLAEVTGAKEWRSWVGRCANAVLVSGVPEQRLPGFWNNVGPCCGDAAIARGFFDLYRAYGSAHYLRFSQRVTADLMRRATLDERGMRWVQAENRAEPDKLTAQTGFMQGAAGIGTWLLHLDAGSQRRPPLVRLPDSPFIA